MRHEEAERGPQNPLNRRLYRGAKSHALKYCLSTETLTLLDQAAYAKGWSLQDILDYVVESGMKVEGLGKFISIPDSRRLAGTRAWSHKPTSLCRKKTRIGVNT